MAQAASSPYLQDKHFTAAMSVAMLLHMLAFVIWVIVPKSPVVEVPVRILNLKLGEFADAEIAASTPVTMPDPSPRVMAAPSPAVKALGRVLETSKEKLKNSKAPPPPPQQPVPVVKANPPAVPKPEPSEKTKAAEAARLKPVEQVAQQFVRERPFDYNPLGQDMPKANGGMALGTSASDQAEILRRYEQLISAWIEKFKIYPPEARTSNIEGRAVVRIRIDRRGNVRYSTIDKTSGSHILDRAVLEMIQRANPMPPVPEDYKAGDLFEFKVPISFQL